MSKPNTNTTPEARATAWGWTPTEFVARVLGLEPGPGTRRRPPPSSGDRLDAALHPCPVGLASEHLSPARLALGGASRGALLIGRGSDGRGPARAARPRRRSPPPTTPRRALPRGLQGVDRRGDTVDSTCGEERSACAAERRCHPCACSRARGPRHRRRPMDSRSRRPSRSRDSPSAGDRAASGTAGSR